MADGTEPGGVNVVKRSPLGEELGSERIFFNLRDAVRAFEQSGKTVE
jgi:hypothetical protein